MIQKDDRNHSNNCVNKKRHEWTKRTYKDEDKIKSKGKQSKKLFLFNSKM